MVGQSISHYRIIEKLGEGGMGVVYKAEDLKLKRIVALKFLPHHLSASPEEEARFLQEAQAAATLNHPNVCTIYDINEAGTQQFIVMEYVEGMTLREKIAGGPLPLEQAVAYALQIGDALHDAHSKGIVHRDIKADNIMVNTKNSIKVMDFGLAKLKGSLKLTRTSSTVGTLAYMAPEQIQGGEVDARSDIFSFGVVLYEILAGRLPFRGDHEAALMYSIINEEPEPLETFLPDAPSELNHVFSRALEKNPEDRYQSVHDMVIDLRRLKKESSKISRASMPAMKVPQTQRVPEPQPTQVYAGAAGAPARRRWLIPSAVVLAAAALAAGYFLFFAQEGTGNGERLPVAVADFVNQTGEQELDGLSGMLITALEQSRRLSVLTRSRMFDIVKLMGNTNVDKIDESLGKAICTQANISTLVTASIRKFGKLYTIDLKVLDIRKNEYIFTAREEGEGQENIPAMLDRLSEKTRAGLKDQAKEATTAKLAAVTTSNMEAYQHFFQGEQLIDRLKFDEAEKEFRKAIDLDSTFGLAWYRLAYTLNWNTASKSRASGAIEKALQLIDRIPEKERYLLRGVGAEQRGMYREAVAILREMEKIYPDDKEMIYNIGDWSFHAGDAATAESYLQKAVAADPHLDRALQHLAWTYRALGKYEKMAEAARQYVASSGSVEAYSLLRDAYVFLGRYDDALKGLESAREVFPTQYVLTRRIADLYLLKGNVAKAETELKSLIASGMPVAARKVGYIGLINYDLVLGKVQDARRFSDEWLKTARQELDTASIVDVSMVRPIIALFILRDPASARKEMEAVFPLLQKRARATLGNWDYVYAVLGDVAALDTLMQTADPTARRLFLSIAYNAQHDCSRGEALMDSVTAPALPGEMYAGLLGALARCQFETGTTDKALASTRKLLDIKELPRTPEYAHAICLLGKIYEAKGEKKLALEQYEKFLALWKDADKDLPDYVDITSKIAKLRRMALQ